MSLEHKVIPDLTLACTGVITPALHHSTPVQYSTALPVLSLENGLDANTIDPRPSD